MTPSMLEAEARLRTSTLDRPTLMKLAVTEYERFPSMLRHLTPEDWERPTECPGWDVRAVGGHCLGMAEMAASMRETLRQQRLPVRGDEPLDSYEAANFLNSKMWESTGNSGRSATSSTRSSRVIRGCTASTSPAPSGSRSTRPLNTTVYSSPMWSTNGRRVTANPVGSVSPARPADGGRSALAARMSNLMQSISAARCRGAELGTVCSRHAYRSEAAPGLAQAPVVQIDCH